MRNFTYHIDSIEHFQYLNKNTISHVSYGRTHAPHWLLKSLWQVRMTLKRGQNTLGEIIKMKIKISFLHHIGRPRKSERAQADINWEDSQPCCFAMRVIHKYQNKIKWNKISKDAKSEKSMLGLNEALWFIIISESLSSVKIQKTLVYLDFEISWER